MAERATHQRWLAELILNQRISGPTIRLDPRYTMPDTRYWLAWARHDLHLRHRGFVARTRAAVSGLASGTARGIGRVSVATSAGLSIYTIYQDGRVAYTTSNGDVGITTLAVLRATAGQAIEQAATSVAGALCSPGGPVGIAACSIVTSAAMQGRGVEAVDAYVGAVDDIAEDMGLKNAFDDRSFGQRVRDLFDLIPGG